MGACVAAAVACAMYSQAKERPRTVVRRSFFCSCEYCGRAPDEGQRSAQCVSCGAHLKANASYGVPHIDSRTLDKSVRRIEIAKQDRHWSEPEFVRNEAPTHDPFQTTEEPKSEPYTPSPGMDMTDMTHPANPVGIFSPIWHQ